MQGRRVNWTLDNEKLVFRNEVGQVLAEAKKASFQDYAFYATAANTGLRVSEIVHLKTENVKMGQLIVVRRKRAELKPEPIEISEKLLEILRKAGKLAPTAWLWAGESMPCSRDRQKKAVVYATEKICEGGHISTREIQRRWRVYVGLAGLDRPVRGPHSLRHYAITEFYRVHRDLRAAQTFAGHSTSTITEVYAHVVDMAEKVQAVKPVF